MLSKKYILALILMSHVISTQDAPAADYTNADKIVQKAMLSTTGLTSTLYKGIGSSRFDASDWGVYSDITLKDYVKNKYITYTNSVAIYLGYTIGQNGSYTEDYLVLRSEALRKLAEMYKDPSNAKPFVIDLKGYRYVFDVYLSWLGSGQTGVGGYFIMNRYKIPESTAEQLAIDRVLKQGFVDASTTEEYSYNEPVKILRSGKIKSSDGVAEIDLNDDTVKAKLVEVANKNKDAVVIEKIVKVGTYYYEYRFVISWGEYTQERFNHTEEKWYKTTKQAFFVSTSFVYLPTATDADKGQKAAYTENSYIPTQTDESINIVKEGKYIT